MDVRTRQQLLALSRAFYDAHAMGFDESRGHRPWPGWLRLKAMLPEPGSADPLAVLDVGCGNARLARFLADAGHRLRYVGVDANRALLEAARARLAPELADRVELVHADFLAGEAPGAGLPDGPFALVALFGVLHHVPGRDWREALLRALARRVAPGGLLALTVWQFAGRDRFERRRVSWSQPGPVLGSPIDVDGLEPGDALLRFGADPEAPPRYCHQVDAGELEALARAAAEEGLEAPPSADFSADGEGDALNRYLVMRRP